MKHQSGNALWFILVAIGLLGLLTVMMSRSSSSTNETGGYEQNVIQANQILSYAKNMENAVQSLLARGCSENDISFWHDSDGNGSETAADDYFNANSPSDYSCHVFDVAGAGMTFESLNKNWLDNSQSAQPLYGQPVFTGRNQINNLEEHLRPDLIILMGWLTQSVCESVNNILFSDITITEDNASFSTAAYTDTTFKTSASSNINLTAYLAHDGKLTACFTSEDEGGFHLYHVLHAR